MRYVVDASVAVKWLLGESSREPNFEQAIDLLLAFGEGRVELIQPPHWLLETCAVVVRLAPELTKKSQEFLQDLAIPIDFTPETLALGLSLAGQLSHHLFDTLYHAVAIRREAILVTADRKYYQKAASLGRVQALSEWRIGEASP
jgi:predicted nucleic acid-binding protein